MLLICKFILALKDHFNSGKPVYADGTVVRGNSIGGDQSRGRLSDEDSLLVERIRADDAVAFNALVKKYRERLFSVIYNMTSNRDDAFDLTQDVFLRAYRGIKGFNGKSAFFTWLYRIAVNVAITHIKKNRVHRFFSLEDMNEIEAEYRYSEYLTSKDKTARAVCLKELQENLNIAMQKLSNKHRAVIVLCEIEGLGSAEVAVILGCSEGTVRSRLHYAKEQLKSLLGNYLG
jgi:RNA polymerase sigma-70 factor (ECF subfamily)